MTSRARPIPQKPAWITKDKEKFSQALSGFANSCGGVIVWGIDCRSRDKDLPDVACGEKPISYLTRLLNDLNESVGQATVPVVEGVENQKIEISKGQDLGFVINYVPRSEHRPHRAQYAAREYWRRSGSCFYRMEHWEIVDMITRQQLPNVNLEFEYDPLEITPNKHVYRLKVKLVNQGNIMVKHFCVKLQVPKYVQFNGFLESEEDKGAYLLTYKGNLLPLFPKEVSTLDATLEYEITHDTEEWFNRNKIAWTLYADNMPPKSGEKALSELHCF